MARGPSPQLGYNTNLRHGGKLYHVQTEDSGIGHPHVITHLFADGGRIVASRKTGYAEHVGAPNLSDVVKKLMQTQHKAMCIALRDGDYDAAEAAVTQPARPSATKPQSERVSRAPGARATRPPGKRASSPRVSRAPGKRASAPPPDVEAFERAAEARLAESKLTGAPVRRRPASTPLGRLTRSPTKPKKLDDAILEYLGDGEKRGKDDA